MTNALDGIRQIVDPILDGDAEDEGFDDGTGRVDGFDGTVDPGVGGGALGFSHSETSRASGGGDEGENFSGLDFDDDGGGIEGGAEGEIAVMPGLDAGEAKLGGEYGLDAGLKMEVEGEV